MRLGFTVATVVLSTIHGTTALAEITRTSVVKTQQCSGLKNGMDYVRLGDSDLVVSKVCMGTMTFGVQNTLEEGVEQLNRAFDHYGINFLDTAVRDKNHSSKKLFAFTNKPRTTGDVPRSHNSRNARKN